MRRTLTTAGLVLASLSAAACGGTSSKSSSGAASKSSPSPMACTHWANIKGDIDAGILTDAELRTKVSEVRGSSSSPAVEKAATLLLSGITSRDKGRILSGYAALEAACK